MLSIWASASFVRHPYNLFVPLSFTVVALAVLSAAVGAWPALGSITVAATVVAAMLLIAAPLTQARQKMWLLGRTETHDLPQPHHRDQHH